MDPIISDAVKSSMNNYYELKKKYEKKKIPKDGVIKCIKCKRPGGTLFSNENGILTAICNSNGKKCNLNINIDLSLIHI